MIRIGGACGFWGDSYIATPQLLKEDKLDYLVFDYLAELTMSILARARASDPDTGYAADFVTEIIQQHLSRIQELGVKVISNAGGVNPRACADAIQRVIDKAGFNLKVAAVAGDDLLDREAAFRTAGVKEMFSDQAFPDEIKSINAYIGAFPIARALAEGADIVVTGRCVDSAVTLGACLHAFGWREDQYDLLASGSLAGHMIECGAQCTGGIFTDWDQVPGWDNIGYPIVEVASDGSFVVTKPAATGGLVSRATVAEQLLYEIGDPASYLLPDVTCDFTQVTIEEAGSNRVWVSPARGRTPTNSLKVTATYQDGFRLGFLLTVIGIDAAAKAQKMGEAVWLRCHRMLAERGMAPFREINTEVMGNEATYGPHRRIGSAREVILKLVAKHDDPKALSLFLREATSTGTSMAVGTCGMGGHRPKPMPLVRLFSFLLDKSELNPQLVMNGKSIDVPFTKTPQTATGPNAPTANDDIVRIDDPTTVPLINLAWGRSGDKGNKSNIGIIARHPDFLPFIRAALSAEAVHDYFSYMIDGEVERFDLPGIGAVNFLLHGSLGGGGIASLRSDPQAKTHAQLLLDALITIPSNLAEKHGLTTG